jgi:hypothetical protein
MFYNIEKLSAFVRFLKVMKLYFNNYLRNFIHQEPFQIKKKLSVEYNWSSSFKSNVTHFEVHISFLIVSMKPKDLLLIVDLIANEVRRSSLVEFVENDVRCSSLLLLMMALDSRLVFEFSEFSMFCSTICSIFGLFMT